MTALPASIAVIDAPLALAFTAGMVATVNPCGFAMLPAYLSYFLGIEGTDDGPAEAGVLRALVVGAVVSLGFVAPVRRGRRHHQLDLVRHRALRLVVHDRDRRRRWSCSASRSSEVGSRGSPCPASTRADAIEGCGRCSCSGCPTRSPRSRARSARS